jgi:hypothetical protein
MEPSSSEPQSQAVAQTAMQQIRALLAFTRIKRDREPALICEGLFLGSISTAMSKETLERHEISHVLTVADRIKPVFPTLYTYKVLAILDSPTCNISVFLQESFEFIESALEAGHKVLVHW